MYHQSTTVKKLMASLQVEASKPHASSTSPTYFDPKSLATNIPRVLAVSGGKGGVGKTLTTANLGLCFAKLGMRTLLIDGDFGLANLDVVLNVRPGLTINNVLAGECSLKEVMLTGPEGLRIIPAASGVLKACELAEMQKLMLLDQIDNLNEEFDFVIIDTPAGVSKNVQYWTSSAAEVVIVVTPEPSALADGYATMKILSQSTAERNFKLIVNMVRSDEEGIRVFQHLASIADEFLNVQVSYLGCIPLDENVREAVRNRASFVQRFPFCPASRSMRSIASQLLAEPRTENSKGTVQFFWKRMIGREMNTNATFVSF